MSTSSWTGAMTLAGILSHLAIFIRGEWDGPSPSIPKFYAAADVVLLAYLFGLRDLGLWDTLTRFILLNIGYFCGLFGSIAVYRVFFHRLCSFPGPRKAKLTALWSSYKTAQGFRFPSTVDDLHRTYGDFVRIRPREISINNPDAVHDIHGPGSVCLKGPFYDSYYPTRSVHMTRDKAYHSQQRRIWDQGFTSTALNQYESRIRQHCQDLVEQFSKRAGTPVNVSLWMNYFGFDVMGDLTFGKSFQMLKSGENSFVLDRYIKTLPIVGLGRCSPWAYVNIQRLPIISRGRVKFSAWCLNQVKERKSMGQSRVDLFTYLLGDGIEETRTIQLSDADLVRNSQLAIVAGSDTTSSTLAAVLFLLAKYPVQQKRLQEELDSLHQKLGGEEPSYQVLVSEAPILNGCISEALRLYPAVLGGVQRMTPPSGTEIAGRWIPGNTIVSTPTYSLHRDPRNFTQPDAFIPDRWFSQPELILRKDAFIPFLTGKYSCVGKNLAYMEMRMVLATIASTFTFRFSQDAGEDISDLFDSGFKDYFTAHAPDFNLVFSPRTPSAL